MSASCLSVHHEENDLRLPVFTIACLSGLLVLYGLQLTPYTGVFLMFAMPVIGPYAVGLLPHLLIVGVALDIASKRLSKLFLIVPACAYGAYYVYYFYEGMVITEFETELATKNPTSLVRFDPNLHSLVSANASEFALRYKVPVVFETNVNFPLGHLSARLMSKQRCEGIKALKREMFEFDVYGASVPLGPDTFRSRNLDQCIVVNHEAPKKTKITVETQQAVKELKSVVFNTETHQLLIQGRPIGSVETATVKRLPWFPFYIVGCGLNSGQPSWECFNALFRKTEILNHDSADMNFRGNAISAVAHVLGLVKYEDSDYVRFNDDLENSRYVDHWLQKRATESVSDFNTWGVRKDSAYMPELGSKSGYESYQGGIYPRKEGGEFLAFITRNQGKTVYIDAMIGSGVNVSQHSQFFGIWSVCKDSDSCVRTDNSFRLKTHFPKAFDGKRIVGYWKVGELEIQPTSGTDNDTITLLQQVFPTTDQD
jgi:hypothetical protein